jgi:hypothetical protein
MRLLLSKHGSAEAYSKCDRLRLYPLPDAPSLAQAAAFFGRSVKFEDTLVFADDSPGEVFERGIGMNPKFIYSKKGSEPYPLVKEYSLNWDDFSWQGRKLICSNWRQYVFFDFQNLPDCALDEFKSFFADYLRAVENPYMIEGFSLKELYAGLGKVVPYGSRDIYARPAKTAPDKLKNALESYASPFGLRREDVFVLVDDTVFGTATTGCVVTKDYLIVKGTISAARYYKLKDLTNLWVSDKSIIDESLMNGGTQIMNTFRLKAGELTALIECVKVVQRSYHKMSV